MADKPITLEWSAPGGQWQKIAEDLENTGRYSWEVPRDAPPRVFVKLTVKDTAGNVGAYQTANPVLIDLSVPEVKSIRLGSR